MLEHDRPTGVRNRFVRRFWADHGDSSVVRAELARVLAELDGDAKGLNVGCGHTRVHPRIVNLDLTRDSDADCLADANALPFPRACFHLVVSQETVEHLPDPFAAVQEMASVLRPGGALYLQMPFVIGYHPGPEDYWRFTGAGMRRLIEQAGLSVERVVPGIGGGTGLHRILVEFVAGAAARVLRSSYLPIKGLAALLFYPLKWLDSWMLKGPEKDRIAGGYIGIGRKPS